MRMLVIDGNSILNRAFFGIKLLNANPDGLNEMGFAHSRSTEHKQRVVGFPHWVLGDCLGNRASHFVAVALAIVLEIVTRIKLRVDVVKFLVAEWIGSDACARLNGLAGV